MLAVAFLCCCQQASAFNECTITEVTTVQVAVVPVVAILAAADATVNQTADVPGGYATGVYNATALRPVQLTAKLLSTVRPKGRLVRKVLNRNRVWKFPILGRLKRIKNT